MISRKSHEGRKSDAVARAVFRLGCIDNRILHVVVPVVEDTESVIRSTSTPRSASTAH